MRSADIALQQTVEKVPSASSDCVKTLKFEGRWENGLIFCPKLKALSLKTNTKGYRSGMKPAYFPSVAYFSHSLSLRSIALLQRTGRVRLRFACPERVEGSISRAACIWDLFDRSENGVFQHPGNT
jgi:hypothetical protein